MIGIFDSGLGGIGIFRKVRLFLPYEDMIYYADNANAPYGSKTEDEIRELTLKSIKILEKKGCKIIIIACNTATTAGINYFRKHTKAHLVGVVPVIKSAAQVSQNKKIAMLATPYTASNDYLDNLIKKYAPKHKIKKIACKDWVNAIEKNQVTDSVIKKCTSQIKSEDVIILGCTHFTLIKGHIQRLVGPDKVVMSSNDAVARHVMRIGIKYKLLHKRKRKPKYTFFCSGNKAKFLKMVKKYVSLS